MTGDPTDSAGSVGVGTEQFAHTRCPIDVFGRPTGVLGCTTFRSEHGGRVRDAVAEQLGESITQRAGKRGAGAAGADRPRHPPRTRDRRQDELAINRLIAALAGTAS